MSNIILINVDFWSVNDCILIIFDLLADVKYVGEAKPYVPEPYKPAYPAPAPAYPAPAPAPYQG